MSTVYLVHHENCVLVRGGWTRGEHGVPRCNENQGGTGGGGGARVNTEYLDAIITAWCGVGGGLQHGNTVTVKISREGASGDVLIVEYQRDDQGNG